MALPASGPLSSSMIAAEFSSSQAPSGPNISLGGLGTKLSLAVTYGQPISSSMFYGQSLVTLTAFGYSGTTPFEDASSACDEGGTSGTAYHNGSGTFPTSGDNVFSDSAGTTALEDGFYRINAGQSMEVESGTVNGNPANCGRSDKRLKRDIIFRTYSKSGIPIYEFEYINKSDGEGRYIGTMAQDLIKLNKSEAVITDKEGYYLVDYNKVDVDFYEI
jgi:hypothetical protein